MNGTKQRRRETGELVQVAKIIRPLVKPDLPAIKVILEHWVKDSITGEVLPDEITEILENMKSCAKGLKFDHLYMICETEGSVAGVMGFRLPDQRMLAYCSSDWPVEFVNAFVDPARRSQGVGTALFKALEEEARGKNYTEVIFNSGPRYKDTVWDFYDRLEGYARVGVAENYYGEGIDAPVWRGKL